MATTTNFGWETPDDTDLVKDGALAMRTLGNAIDTSMADLKGGTTGQVLSKTSNTDMDFTWVTSDDANAIQNAIVDAKGDLITATAADTPARLAVGNDGETIVADSAATTGLRYTAGVGLTQPIINGGFDVWQRGTSRAYGTVGGYGADRWVIVRNGWAGGATMSRQSGTAGIQYAARVQRDSGNTSTAYIATATTVETANAIYFQGKTVTLSFYARIGANFSGGSNLLDVKLVSGTGTDQNVVTTGFTGAVNAINQTPTLTTSWQRFSYTVTLGASVTELAPYFSYVPVGTAGADDWFEVTGVQIDLGQTALPFRRSGGTIQGETALCQRYYYRTGSGNLYRRFSTGQAYSSTQVIALIQFPVPMRTSPTSLEQSGTASDYGLLSSTGNSAACTSVPAFDAASINGGNVIFVASGLGGTAGHASQVFANNNANAYLGWSAEL